MKILYVVNYVIAVIFTLSYAYQFVFIPIVWFLRKKVQYPEAAFDKRYAVLICARNESLVIADLIHSLRDQTYDQSKLSVFVLADNCTDNTAEIALGAGADGVYVRNNLKQIGKGYALDELLKHLKEDYPEGFDAYFVFDADNILKKDYIEQMNRAFCAGNDIVTSYRNSKNFGDNWISAGVGLWYLRESRYLNHARAILKSSCSVSGTGFMFSQKIVDELGGWPFHLLIEDIEFSLNQITTTDHIIAFCPDAELYDEQPIKFSQSWRQRLRWCRGYLQVMKAYFSRLVKGIFHGSFSCYDLTMNIAPAYALSTLAVVMNVALVFVALIRGENFLNVLRSVGSLLLSGYLTVFIVGLVTVITEWKHIQNTSLFKRILYTFTFPVFMATYIPISIVSYFCKVTWKPIVHTRSLTAMGREKEISDSRKEDAPSSSSK